MKVKEFKNGNINLQLEKSDYDEIAAYDDNKGILCNNKLWEHNFVNQAVTWFYEGIEYIDFYYLNNGLVYYVSFNDLHKMENGKMIKFTNGHLPDEEEKEEFEDWIND